MANNVGAPAASESSEHDALGQECVEMLVQHGYHRASLADIPIYERVVGGLVFCLQSEELTSVDCDILFRPVATVKERVRVAEAICQSFNTALLSYTKMNRDTTSAFTLSVHELQGANYAKLKQVVAWLVQHTQVKLHTRVQKAIETQWHAILPPTSRVPPSRGSTPLYRVVRQSMLQEAMPRALSEQARIQRCLLEYGEKLGAVAIAATSSAEDVASSPGAPSPGKNLLRDIATQAMKVQQRAEVAASSGPAAADLDDFDRRYKDAEKAAHVAEQKALMEQKRTEDELLKHAAPATDVCKWSHAPVNVTTLQAATLAYDTTSKDLRQRLSHQDASTFGALAEMRKVTRDRSTLVQKIQAQTALVEKAKHEYAIVEGETKRLEALEHASHQQFESIERKQEHIEMLEAAHTRTDADDLLKLRGLIALHTNLKLQESQFKTACKEQLVALQKRVQDLPVDTRFDDGTGDVAQVEAKQARMAAKRNEMKRALAKEAQGILAAMRLIDDIPSRSELIQYEKRFIELYEEVALTLDETRKYYSIYNTQETTYQFLEKEVALIDSINDNFQVALESKEASDIFFNQMHGIIANVRDNVTKQQGTVQARQLAVDTLDSKYQLLLEKQQAYVSAIRDFQKECEKNTKLTAHLESLRTPAAT
ncbi:Aste57867_24196 [Aphanomyces stellatus]|uniref:Aste57867_24196 protein n=1 Tax=Aphanomyces stellatus TaxID=120398 RepID=A0A485LPR7_9STRA|nr:hypothetical protein As57867_024122 [Aphanomyces stellatus]VFU00838.1 Aste57867_24196 [Aphanomyces stellatus]